MQKKIIFSLICMALLTVLVAACKITDEAALASGPKVRMGPSTFIDTTITIKKGQSITLVDTAASPHIIVNGTWEGSTQKPGAEPGAPKANLNFSGQGSKPLGPFTTAGTFKYYCTIHGGMNLTVTVQ